MAEGIRRVASNSGSSHVSKFRRKLPVVCGWVQFFSCFHFGSFRTNILKLF